MVWLTAAGDTVVVAPKEILEVDTAWRWVRFSDTIGEQLNRFDFLDGIVVVYADSTPCNVIFFRHFMSATIKWGRSFTTMGEKRVAMGGRVDYKGIRWTCEYGGFWHGFDTTSAIAIRLIDPGGDTMVITEEEIVGAGSLLYELTPAAVERIRDIDVHGWSAEVWRNGELLRSTAFLLHKGAGRVRRDGFVTLSGRLLVIDDKYIVFQELISD